MNNLLYATVLLIVLLFSLVLYYFPKLFVFFFSSHLGNIILIVGVLLLGFYNYRLAIGMGSIFVILFQAYRLSHSSSSKEGFSWSADLVDQFIKYQKTFNPDKVFDMSIVQQQASPEDVQYLFANDTWPWSSDIQQLYKDYVATDSTISMDPDEALTVAQSVYNETAIKELMAWNTKEGTFLLSGVTIGHTEGLPDNMNNIVRCGMDASGSSVMEKTIHIGYASIHGDMIQNTEVVDNNDIPSVVPGFKFLAESCNPCGAMNDTPDYSCPFSLDVGDGAEVSSIWQKLWGLSGGGNEDVEEKKNAFPLLNELKKELDNVSDLYNPVITSDKGMVGVQSVLDKSNNTKESSELNSNM